MSSRFFSDEVAEFRGDFEDDEWFEERLRRLHIIKQTAGLRYISPEWGWVSTLLGIPTDTEFQDRLKQVADRAW